MRQTPSKNPINSSSNHQVYFIKHPLSWLRAFWRFARPHTIIGTSLSVLALYGMAIATCPAAIQCQPITSALSLLSALLFTLLACLCGNVYIVGLNQLEDVNIDRINKPTLPLASGEFSRQQAVRIVLVCGILALGLALLQGPYLLAMVALSLMIGTAYSLPPLRLKRFPFWASVCIFTVRGIVVNLGLFLHFSSLKGFNPPGFVPPQVWMLTLFVLVFTFAIAIFKDIPDMEGDRQYEITTLTLTLGQQTVFNLARWVITVCYVGMVLAAMVGVPGVNAPFLIATHLVLLAIFWIRSTQVDLTNKAAISRFYQFIWKLFFLEYLLFPIACLLENTKM